VAAIRKHDEIPISSVVLNPENFRHRPAQSQEEALGFLFETDIKRSEMLALATDIAQRGLDPSNLPIVEPVDGHWRVLEGNRRFAAMKVMLHPDLLPDLSGLDDRQMQSYRTKFAKLGGAAAIPKRALCFVTDDEEMARHLIALKHTGAGAHKGAGTILWDSEGRARYELSMPGDSERQPSASNKQTARALALLDALETHFSDDDEILTLVQDARKRGLTTLGRLLAKPENQLRLGVQLDGRGLRIGVDRASLRAAMHRVLSDLGTPRLNSRSTNKAADVVDYLDDIADDLPTSDNRLAESEPATSPSEANGQIQTKPKRRTKREPIMRKPFVGLKLYHASPKTQSFLSEIQTLRIEDYPYALACSVRTLIDLYTADVIRALNRKFKESPSARARDCLKLLDPPHTKHSDRRFPRIADALENNTGDLSIDTMNGFMHRPHHHPTADTIRKQVSDYQPWLQALDDYVEENVTEEP
jgi:hypothetical protein